MSERWAPAGKALQVVAALVALMWISEIVDAATSGDLDSLGIEPREPDGLLGILLAPFLHGGFAHLIANTIPFLILGGLIALSGLVQLLLVTAIVILVGGGATWLLAGDGTVHIGASGVVFGDAAYLIARGVFSRNLLHLAVGALIVLFFGTTLLWGLIPDAGVSWHGHFFGAVGGVVAARALRNRSAGMSRNTPRGKPGSRDLRT
jgi:membrane associated rhomboid family serine protease